MEEDSFQQAESYFSILSSFQSIIGVVLAGVLYALIPINILFFIVGGCYIGSAISEMFIRYNSEFEKRDEKLTIKIVFADIGDGFKYLASIKPILAALICVLFANFFFSPIFDNFMPYFIATDITGSNYFFHENMAPEMWQSFFTVAFGIGSLIMGIVMSSLKQREKYHQIIRLSLLGVAIMIGIFALFYALFINNIIDVNTLLIITLVAFLITGVLLVLFNISTSTTMMRMIDKDKFGKVTSVSNVGSQGLIPLAMFLGGIAITYLGSIGLLAICTGGFLLTAIMLFILKPVKEL